MCRSTGDRKCKLAGRLSDKVSSALGNNDFVIPGLFCFIGKKETFMFKLLRYLNPYRTKLIIMVIVLLIQVMGTLYVPTLTSVVVNDGVVKGDLSTVWKTGTLMLAVSVITSGFSVLETYLSTVIFGAVERDIRNDLFEKTQSLKISDFKRFGAGSLIVRCTNDIAQIKQAFMSMTEMLLPAPIMSIVGLVLAFDKSPSLAMLIVISMLFACMVMVMINTKAIKLFEDMIAMLDRINSKLREYLSGIRVIRAFNRSSYEENRMNNEYENYASLNIRINRIFSIMMPLIMMIMNFCIVAIVALGGKNIADGKMQIGDIMAVIEYSSLILMYLIMGIMTFMDLPRAQTSARRINEIMDIKDTYENRNANFGVKKDAPLLEFCNVTFQYQGAEEPVLNNISFTAESGKTTAIIGGTGSGKSTIANLIPRFYDVQSGSIRIEGNNIVDIPLEELRQRIGFVPQKAFLFSGTIMDNLRHGKKDATLEEAEHAAKIAQIDSFIEEQKDGYETKISQEGSNLSGGQKQRMAIARALIRKPEIYVFDDCFSALDFKTDALLRSALKEETKNAAVVLVAQRISTILDADQIVVLDEGRVVGVGTHKELLENCDVYRQIARSQFSKEELS